MCAKWNDKYNPEILATGLEGLKHFDDSGQFKGFEAFESHDYLTVLESSLGFDKQIPEAERRRLLYKAVFYVAKNGQITVKKILAAVSKEENAYLNKPKQQFVLATSISIEYFNQLRKVSINNISITFSKSLPNRFNRLPIQKRWKQLNINDTPSSYTNVKVFVKAREEREAFNIAIDALDLLRGIWNLSLNGTRLFGFPQYRNKPTNKVTLGSLHTLHLPDGTLATDMFWFEPDYVENTQKISGRWQKLHRFEKDVRKALSKHLYKGEIEDAIRRYARALDHRDMHVSFLELWALLETLTATLQAKYDTTIERTTFHYKDAKFAKQVLEHLRNYRNANVHAGQRSEQIETFVFQLKRYVEDLLFFHIRNRFKFKSIEDTAKFFDLPKDKADLDRRIQLLNDAKKYRS